MYTLNLKYKSICTIYLDCEWISQIVFELYLFDCKFCIMNYECNLQMLL